MISKIKFIFLISFLLSLSVWLGAGVYHSIQTTLTWYKDPRGYVYQITMHPLQGEINPFPFLGALTTLTTIIILIAFFKYQGNGYKEVRISVYGTIGIILVTAIYFVPTLLKILSDPPIYSSTELISNSRMWLILNIVRLLLTAAIFIYGLIGLSKSRNSN